MLCVVVTFAELLVDEPFPSIVIDVSAKTGTTELNNNVPVAIAVTTFFCKFVIL
jgi:hypothetical protein